MSKETKIEWADSTLNFWSGCTKVSAGCANCYAEALSNRKLGNIGEWGKGAPRKRHQSAFNLALRLNKQPWICDECGHEHVAAVAKDASEIIECRGCLVPVSIHRRRVFSLSLGDWLDPEVPIEWLAEMLDTIRQCDQLQWLLVTKRPELWKSRMEQVIILENISDELFQWVRLWLWQLKDGNGDTPKNVMVLTSVENQQAADERIPALLAIPGRRGLSCEPLLGPVTLARFFWDKGMDRMWPNKTGEKIDWVIVGGESGPGARACNVEWLRDIVEECAIAGVPCFVKQLGANPTQPMLRIGSPSNEDIPLGVTRLITSKKGGDITEWPHELRVRQFPEAV